MAPPRERRGAPPRNRRGAGEWYRSTCPYCGKSWRKRAADGGGERTAIAALRTHVLASDGGGHGPRYELPDIEALSLAEHVVRVDGGGDSQGAA